MSKKIIQVPMDADLLKKLNYSSRQQKKARAEVIREACLTYLAAKEVDELERQQVEGYQRIPETVDSGKAQEALLKEILPEESW